MIHFHPQQGKKAAAAAELNHVPFFQERPGGGGGIDLAVAVYFLACGTKFFGSGA